MADGRRYLEDEIGEIFALAADAGATSLPVPAGRRGLTLGELQEVGEEVGLAPERVARAAASLDIRDEPRPRGTSLGAPVSVGRVVELPRAVTDREWQILVADLRETFGARGRLSAHDDLREWTNGNLHAYLEPTENGQRLRLGTRKFGAKAAMAVGIVGLLLGLVLLTIVVGGGGSFRASLAMLISTFFAVSGAGTLARSQIRLRRWADEREGQMEHIAARVRALTEGPPLHD